MTEVVRKGKSKVGAASEVVVAPRISTVRGSSPSTSQLVQVLETNRFAALPQDEHEDDDDDDLDDSEIPSNSLGGEYDVCENNLEDGASLPSPRQRKHDAKKYSGNRPKGRHKA